MKKSFYLTIGIYGFLLAFCLADIFDHNAFQIFLNKYSYFTVAFFSIISLLLTIPPIKKIANILINQRKKINTLQKIGRKAFAKILKIEETGFSLNEEPQLRITVSIKPELVITFEDFIPLSHQGGLEPGQTVEILYDPENPASAVCLF